MDQLSQSRVRLIVWVILLLFPLVGMGVDLISPSLPAIAKNLHISSALAKNLVSIYLFGFMIGTFWVGFLSDAWGRRKILLGGLLGFTIVSFLPVCFPYAMVLLLARFFQGLTLAAMSVLARAIFADLLNHDGLMRTMVWIATMWGIGPIIGPVIGGYLQYYFGWQACFVFFALYSFSGFALLLMILPETLVNRQALQFSQIKNNLWQIFSSGLFVGLVLIMATTYSLLIVFNVLGPFFVQKLLGHSPIYFGHIAFCFGIIFLIGTFVCRQLLKTFSANQLFQFAIPVYLFVALLGVIASFVDGESMMILVFISAIMFFACGILYPAAMSAGVMLFRNMAGSSSSVMSLLNMFATALTAFLTSFISVKSSMAINGAYFLLMLVCMLVYVLMVKPNENAL